MKLFFRKNDFVRFFRNIFRSQILEEIFFIFCLGLLLFISFALLSYNKHDFSAFYFSNKHQIIKNFCGPIGANLAAFLIYLLGFAAYIFVFLPIILIWLRVFGLRDNKALKVFGFCTFLLTFSSFLSLYFSNNYYLFQGGLLGLHFSTFLKFYFNIAGSILVLSIFSLIAIVLMFDISFVSIFLFCLSLLSKIFNNTAGRINYLLKNGFIKFSLLGAVEKLFKKSDFMIDFNDYLNNFLYTETDNIFESFDLSLFVEKTDSAKVDLFSNEFIPAFENVESNYKNKDFSAVNSDFIKLINKYRGFKIVCTGHKVRKSKILQRDFVRIANSAINKNIFNLLGAIYFKEMQFFNFNDSDGIIENKSQITSFVPKIEYVLPDLSIFEAEKTFQRRSDNFEIECRERAKKVEEKLFHFGIRGSITSIRPGPVITLFEYTPQIDTKISRIIALEDDLALALKATSIRIIAPIPGRSVVGFEISNQNRESVKLSDIILTDSFSKTSANLPIVLGVDIVGNPVVEDLTALPHLLIAGSTGSGKSVGLNAMLCSLLCKLTPKDLKLILIDPKRLEFASYSDIPHLLFPIITEARRVTNVLKWVVSEMENRYESMSKHGVKNLFDYHKLCKNNSDKSLEFIPWIVIIIDELADVMMVAGKEVEFYITRIAQMARAAGIHMIAATQRPSVDVVTGLIKVNFPSRIGYRVSSKIDSKTILDSSGAEKLLGKGDLLYLNTKSSALERIHGPYVSDKEIEILTNHLKSQQLAEYLDINELTLSSNSKDENSEVDELYVEIVSYVKSLDEISISMLQRRYRIGFNRSARIIEKLENDGILAPAQGSKPRKVLRP